jgi:hypothetical protein
LDGPPELARPVNMPVRLMRVQPRRGDGQNIGRFAETVSRFTEGFDTPDLKEAKMLLEELSK